MKWFAIVFMFGTVPDNMPTWVYTSKIWDDGRQCVMDIQKDNYALGNMLFFKASQMYPNNAPNRITCVREDIIKKLMDEGLLKPDFNETLI